MGLRQVGAGAVAEGRRRLSLKQAEAEAGAVCGYG